MTNNTRRIFRLLIMAIIAAGIALSYSFITRKISLPINKSQITAIFIPLPVICDGHIDVMPTTESNEIIIKDDTLFISGRFNKPADVLFVTLTNIYKDMIYFKARRTPRFNLKQHDTQFIFISESGFEINADVSQLNGHYTLGISSLYEGKLEDCANIHAPLISIK